MSRRVRLPAALSVAAWLLLAVGGAPLPAEEEQAMPLDWPHQDFAALSTAASEAKQKGRRLLVGLSGGPT